jgi:hypothetical protein
MIALLLQRAARIETVTDAASDEVVPHAGVDRLGLGAAGQPQRRLQRVDNAIHVSGVGADAEKARGGALDQRQRRLAPAGVDGKTLVAPAAHMAIIRQPGNDFAQGGRALGLGGERIAQLDPISSHHEPVLPAREQRRALAVQPAHGLPGDNPRHQRGGVEAIARRQAHGHARDTWVSHASVLPSDCGRCFACRAHRAIMRCYQKPSSELERKGWMKSTSCRICRPRALSGGSPLPSHRLVKCRTTSSNT